MPSYIELDKQSSFPASSNSGKVILGINNSSQLQVTNSSGQSIGVTGLPYQVYTALLTQSGEDDPAGQTSGTVTKGITYFVYETTEGVSDFSNVGGKFQTPGLGDYYFVATITGTPNNYGGATVNWNTGAPTTKVLNNTIEDIWFTFNGNGEYIVKSNGLFTLDKTFVTIGSAAEAASNGVYITAISSGDSSIIINSVIVTTLTPVNDELLNTSFEIRLYN